MDWANAQLFLITATTRRRDETAQSAVFATINRRAVASSRLSKISSEAAFKPFLLELIGPADDRGYYKFNRIRGLSS